MRRPREAESRIDSCVALRRAWRSGSALVALAARSSPPHLRAADGGSDFPFLTLDHHDPQEFLDIIMCREVALAIPGANESPATGFFEAHARIGPGDFKVGDDLVGREGHAGEIEERMNLCHRTVDPPTCCPSLPSGG